MNIFISEYFLFYFHISKIITFKYENYSTTIAVTVFFSIGSNEYTYRLVTLTKTKSV